MSRQKLVSDRDLNWMRLALPLAWRGQGATSPNPMVGAVLVKGGMVVALQRELGLPIKFVGLGEQADDLLPFNASQFAQALFEE